MYILFLLENGKDFFPILISPAAKLKEYFLLDFISYHHFFIKVTDLQTSFFYDNLLCPDFVLLQLPYNIPIKKFASYSKCKFLSTLNY